MGKYHKGYKIPFEPKPRQIGEFETIITDWPLMLLFSVLLCLAALFFEVSAPMQQLFMYLGGCMWGYGLMLPQLR